MVEVTPAELRERVEGDGKIPVWDIPGNRWRRCHPVDAREMLTMGVGSFEGKGEAPRPRDRDIKPKTVSRELVTAKGELKKED